jgi:four helix bundle protein
MEGEYASGSLNELDTLTEVLFELNLIGSETKENIFNRLNKVTALLNGLKKSISLRISK